MVGFIEKNSQFMCDVYPTYRPWAEALSLFQVACANPLARIVGRGPGLPITFNPWCIGPSRFGYKSTPLKFIAEPALEGAGLCILPPRFSVEGYYVLIREEKLDHAVLIRDETTGLITETSKQYLADEPLFLSELLDGRLSGRVTVKHGKFPGMNIRVNFATATTPHILTLLDAGFWVQGLGNRLVPIYYNNSVKDSVPADTAFGFSGQIKEFASVLRKMYETKVQWVTPDEDVKKRIQLEEYTRRGKAYEEFFEDKFDILPGLYFECQVFIQKVAALKAIDRQPGVREPIIKMKDYNWAYKWIEERFVEFQVLVKDWVEAQYRKKSATLYVTPERRIYRILEKHKNGCTKTQLNNSTHLTKKQRDLAISNLKEMDKIVETKVIGDGGRWVSVIKINI